MLAICVLLTFTDCRLLRGDERNFQAWAYWRALTKKMGLPPEELLDYATSKIEVRPECK